MTVLVTGGAGFIGSHTCDALLERGHHVRVLDALGCQPSVSVDSGVGELVSWARGEARNDRLHEAEAALRLQKLM